MAPSLSTMKTAGIAIPSRSDTLCTPYSFMTFRLESLNIIIKGTEFFLWYLSNSSTGSELTVTIWAPARRNSSFFFLSPFN